MCIPNFDVKPAIFTAQSYEFFKFSISDTCISTHSLVMKYLMRANYFSKAKLQSF